MSTLQPTFTTARDLTYWPGKRYFSRTSAASSTVLGQVFSTEKSRVLNISLDNKMFIHAMFSFYEAAQS